MALADEGCGHLRNTLTNRSYPRRRVSSALIILGSRFRGNDDLRIDPHFLNAIRAKTGCGVSGAVHVGPTCAKSNNLDIDDGSCGDRIRNNQTVTSLTGGTKESIFLIGAMYQLAER